VAAPPRRTDLPGIVVSADNRSATGVNR